MKKIHFIFFIIVLAISCFQGPSNSVKSSEKKPVPMPGIGKNSDSSKNYLLEAERRTIEIYQNAASSVVNVSNIALSNNFFYGQVEVPRGMGSGFVWDSDGHIVTNFHVVQGGDSFVITFKGDATQYKAKLVGVDPSKDIAVLKLLNLPSKIFPIVTGDSSDLLVGQMSIAIGSPFGLDHTMTTGIVSALNREIDGIGGVKIKGMIQTDASINQGNSGGPLLDSRGYLIGMNTAILSPSGSNAGLGFAVPANAVSVVVPQLIKHGKIIRPGLGIGILEDAIRERYLGPKGIAISYIDEKGSAAKAGLNGMQKDSSGRIVFGDVILKIDNKEVNTYSDIFTVLENYKIGDTVTIHYLRDGKEKQTQAVLQALGQ